MFKKMLLVLPLLVAAFLHLRVEAETSIKGIYTQLSGHQFQFDGKTVEVIEFTSFYCGGCYVFQKSVPVIRGNFPKRIKWKTIPIYWGKASTKPVEAYLLAEESGMGEEMKMALFNAYLVEKKDIGDLKVLEEIGTKMGLGFDFSKRLRAGDKSRDVQKARDTAKEYGVEETPTLIIAGNIMTSPRLVYHNLDAFRENILIILRSILQRYLD